MVRKKMDVWGMKMDKAETKLWGKENADWVR
jgi:hypothetical protein